MKVVIEGLILSFLLYLSCAVGIRNGAVNMAFLYSEDVQERTVANGLTTKEKLQKSKKLFIIFGLIAFLAYTVICVFAVNGTRGFLPSFVEFLVILMIAQVFDRIVIDLIWVGHTKAWIIPGTEDLMPYIPVKAHVMKWTKTIIMCPVAAAVICGIMSLILK